MFKIEEKKSIPRETLTLSLVQSGTSVFLEGRDVDGSTGSLLEFLEDGSIVLCADSVGCFCQEVQDHIGIDEENDGILIIYEE